MPIYTVRQQEIWDTYTEIEADTEEQALELVSNGDGAEVSCEYNRQYDDFAPEVEK